MPPGRLIEGVDADAPDPDDRRPDVAVADALDAMISDRPYSESKDLAEAHEELRRYAGTQFDPAVVAALEGIIDEKTQRQVA